MQTHRNQLKPIRIVASTHYVDICQIKSKSLFSIQMCFGQYLRIQVPKALVTVKGYSITLSEAQW